MNTSTTIPTGERSGAPSTEPAALPKAVIARPGSKVSIGDTLLVKLDENIRRPLIVTKVKDGRVCGTLFCEPDDRTTPAIRTLGQGSSDPARIVGSPDRHATTVYAEHLQEGMGLGEWITRPTRS